MLHPWVGLSDQVRLGVLTQWVTPDLVDEAIGDCGRRGKKPGALPARTMVYFVLGLALFHQDSYDDVAENLVSAIPGLAGDIPNKSSFTRARQRLGAEALETVFHRVAGPIAPDGTTGSFWRGMRVAAVDGFFMDTPDTAANREAFGGPTAPDGSRNQATALGGRGTAMCPGYPTHARGLSRRAPGHSRPGVLCCSQWATTRSGGAADERRG